MFTVSWHSWFWWTSSIFRLQSLDVFLLVLLQFVSHIEGMSQTVRTMRIGSFIWIRKQVSAVSMFTKTEQLGSHRSCVEISWHHFNWCFGRTEPEQHQVQNPAGCVGADSVFMRKIKGSGLIPDPAEVQDWEWKSRTSWEDFQLSGEVTASKEVSAEWIKSLLAPPILTSQSDAEGQTCFHRWVSPNAASWTVKAAAVSGSSVFTQRLAPPQPQTKPNRSQTYTVKNEWHTFDIFSQRQEEKMGVYFSECYSFVNVTVWKLNI